MSDASSPQELSGLAADGVLLSGRSYRDAFDEILTGLMGEVIRVKATPAVPLDRTLTDMTEDEFTLALPYRSRGRARHGLMQLLELEPRQPHGELKPVETARPMRPEPLHT